MQPRCLAAALLILGSFYAIDASATAQVDACGRTAPLDKAYLAGIEKYVTARLRGSDVVLVAEGEGGQAIVVFVRRGKSWQGYGVTALGGIQAVYRSEAGDVFVWTYEGRGDPPAGYTMLRISALAGEQYCSRVDPPLELNRSLANPANQDWRGEYLSFAGFTLDHSGRGVLYGSSEVARSGGTVRLRFRYDTADRARTWSPPQRIAHAPAPVSSVLLRIGTHDPALLTDLKRQAR